MIELYIANKNYSSWSLRPWLLMTVLDIPFTEHLVLFGDRRYAEFFPAGRVPVLVDGETTVWDSLAIVEYLAERHGGVWPREAKGRAFARSAAAEMHSGFSALRNICSMSCGVRVALHEKPAALQRDLARIGQLWSEGLRRFGGPFLGGADFSAVDAFYAPVASRSLTYGLDFGSDAANAYAERLLALPAMKAWYEAGLAETVRDASHEDEIAAVGTIMQDLRAKA